MMKASISLVFGIAAAVAVLVTTPVAAQPWRLDNPNGWIDRFKAESAAKWRAERHAAEAERRAAEAAPTTKRGFQFSLFSFRFGSAKSKDERMARLSSQSEHNRAPEGIYQFGQQVGTVELPRMDKSKSTVFFQRIVGAMNLNNRREFEYRNYVLRIRRELGETTSDLSGQRNRALFAVECDIVGPASTASISR